MERLTPALCPAVTGWEVVLLCHDEKYTIILRIDPAAEIDGHGCIGRTGCQVLEYILDQCSALSNGVEIAIFAVRVDHAIQVHYRRIHAPLKAVRMGGVALATDCSIGVSRTALRAGVLESPLDVEVGIKLGHKVSFRSHQIRRVTEVRTPVGV